MPPATTACPGPSNRSLRPRRILGLHILAAMGSLAGFPVAAQEVTYSGSVAYSRGSYIFSETTHSVWLSSALTLRSGPFTIAANLPVGLQNGGVVNFVAGQPLPTGGESHGAVGRRGGGRVLGSRGMDGPSASAPSGSAVDDSVTVVFRDDYKVEVGDPLLRTSFEILSGTGFLRSITVQAGAKAPLRTLESGVGTGQWDFSGGASLVVGSGFTLLFADVSYWSFGDLPDLELDGAVFFGAGISRLVMDARGSLLLSLSGASSIAETMDAPLSASLGFSFGLATGKTLSTGISLGLSEASPDLAAYVGWGLRLRGP